jgi:hypothetical protein
MAEQQDRRPELMERAQDTMSKLSHEERQALLIKGWMSHDARWFMAVAEAYGPEAACRLNQVAAHGVGKVEALRLVRELGLPPVAELDDYLVLQEVLIGFLGPELIDYEVVQTDDETYEIQVRRCFAHENVTRAGVADSYECGIFARVTGWMEALGLRYEMTPSLGKCLKVEGRECVYAFKLKA